MNIKAFKVLVAGCFVCMAAGGTATPMNPAEADASAEHSYQAAMQAEEARLAAAANAPLLIAKDGGGRRVRQKNIKTEANIKRVGDKTSIDFEAADITGARRTPLGSMINQNRADKEYDFVKIRLSWHPEMINSAASLDTKND